MPSIYLNAHILGRLGLGAAPAPLQAQLPGHSGRDMSIYAGVEGRGL